ncbi:sigma-70 family RNA polymerase sigma factor [Oscillatoria amoena NRMC-F 0135]|uniref:Sigma-70 family RNA polymerase sigma factor n=1 Tax=Geitlerinema calcuttense NRMC-F 0142 TaxID=2922238 RepID=A0ABT7LWF5_9CYAN|nr:sigma-70 family RNA polymerase sigma factor [Geitlerinema calcuttense]MDL5045164.1 sigma-70 family RNA polymerase sigma factor [Oscillatoria amoena NRMC-F 0135]MDL5056352.1 sigma-70 family RNA polymerase sigma factor [Geitlerinema calcuttense NRMC-F 0142]
MNSPGNGSLDTLLQQLALEAQQHPPCSQERYFALTKLVNAILQSKRLYRPSSQQFLNYDDIYNEARQELFLYICKNIGNYNPEIGSVMAWVNSLMERRFIRDVRAKESKHRKTLSDLDNIPQEDPPPESLAELVKKCLIEDRGGHFKDEHITNRSDANLRAIALLRLEGKTWKEISQEFDIPIPTLSSFYQRSLRKLTPLLQDFCLNYEK